MPTLTTLQADLIGASLGFFFTLALLSYLIGDNPLYRIALHVFIGVSVGYILLVIIYLLGISEQFCSIILIISFRKIPHLIRRF